MDNEGSINVIRSERSAGKCGHGKMKSTSLNGYHLFSTEVEYGGVKQRWVVVFSEKAFARETKTLDPIRGFTTRKTH